jgi:anti-sigma factor RsiW
MSDATPPIGEDDLHAYVDGQLGAGRRHAVERHLAANPEAARRVAAYQAQRDALRAAFAAHTDEPLPPALDLAHIIGQRSRRRRTPWLVAASVALALGAGTAGGWLLRGPPALGPVRQAMAVLEQEALASHIVYSADRRHPVEVPGAEAAHLQQWLSNRLGRAVVAPDLSALGYRLVGGRLLATERGGAAALLMYEDAGGQRLSLLLRPMGPALRAPGAVIGRGGVNGLAWIGHGLGVAVVAALPEGDIERVAAQVGAGLGVPA